VVCLSVENLFYTYPQGFAVLKGISFAVRAGKCLGIVGLNGCGKTTLCYCLCGIIPHFYKGVMEGRVLVNGRDTKDHAPHTMAERIGIVLQDPNEQLLMPTVEDELAFSLENHRVPREQMRERVYRTMDLLGITGLKDEHPHRLSGGEKQLVALAAVLTLEPSTIIFDESLSMLDAQAAGRLKTMMKKLKEQGKTLVIVDHTLQAFDLFDQVLVLENGRTIFNGAGDALRKDPELLKTYQLVG
jgi:energy-coupling factor transport system ATP-binding protein